MSLRSPNTSSVASAAFFQLISGEGGQGLGTGEFPLQPGRETGVIGGPEQMFVQRQDGGEGVGLH